jgi:hypothetical protein
VLFALAAFAKFISDILAVLAVPDKNRDEWRFHERFPFTKNASTLLAQKSVMLCK